MAVGLTGAANSCVTCQKIDAEQELKKLEDIERNGISTVLENGNHSQGTSALFRVICEASSERAES